MAEVYQLVDAVRAAVQMAYAALSFSRLNAVKIAELEQRLRQIEAQLDHIVEEYEQQRAKTHGKATSAGIWRVRAERLQRDLTQITSQLPGAKPIYIDRRKAATAGFETGSPTRKSHVRRAAF